MASKTVIHIPVPATVTAGDAVDVRAFKTLGFAVFSVRTSGTSTLQFQQSFDLGVNWANVGSALTAVGVASAKFDDNATHIRVNVTAASSPVGQVAMTSGVQ